MDKNPHTIHYPKTPEPQHQQMSHQITTDAKYKAVTRPTLPCALVAIPDDAKYKVVPQVGIPDALYEKLMSEVMALPEKKRGKWKNTLTDKRGTRTRVRYSDGKLENYNNLPSEDGTGYLQCVYGWVEVVNEDELPEGTVKVSPFAKWTKELETTAPDLTEADKLEIWAEMTKSDREHTNSRAGGDGKHGEVNYSWCKGKQ